MALRSADRRRWSSKARLCPGSTMDAGQCSSAALVRGDQCLAIVDGEAFGQDAQEEFAWRAARWHAVAVAVEVEPGLAADKHDALDGTVVRVDWQRL